MKTKRVLNGIAAFAFTAATALATSVTSADLTITGFNRSILFHPLGLPNMTLSGPSGPVTLSQFDFVSGVQTFTSGDYILGMVLDGGQTSTGSLSLNGNGTFSGFFDVFVELTFNPTGGGGPSGNGGDILGEWGSPGIGVDCSAGTTCAVELRLNALGTWHDSGGALLDTMSLSEESGVPEPATAGLLVAAIGLGCYSRRRVSR